MITAIFRSIELKYALHDSKWKGCRKNPLILANELLTNRHQGSFKITVIPNNTHTKELPIFFFFFLTARHQARRFHHRRIIYWQGENRSQNLIGSYCETSHNLGIIMRCLDSLWNSSAISKTQIVTYLLNTIRPSSNYRKLDREYVFNALKTSVFRAVLRQKKNPIFLMATESRIITTILIVLFYI